AGELRRTYRRLRRGTVVPAARLCRVSRAARAGGDRLALFLVPRRGCRVHQGRRRAAALRLRLVVPIAGLRPPRRRRQGVPRGRLHRRPAGRGPRRVPEPHGLDHPDPDAALRRDHPVHAVLVRAPVLGAGTDGVGALGGDARRDGAAARRKGTAEAAPGGVEKTLSKGYEGGEGYEGEHEGTHKGPTAAARREVLRKRAG